ncbi:hypothetical protein QWY87_02975 [Lutimonas halocynthiae]|uniref:hypothetical protein n=1 Tax=Lutimonas halocynthiae TaxID=1446477 RepID=UPI0025B60638|nr:hypothetical protein [Lutimonas halocynthiae]MDN3641648.1 hypothetical protein [Lutimonas halocynthiae]
MKSRLINKYSKYFQYGTVLYSILYQCKKLGIEISPYYLEKEFDTECKEPVIRDIKSNYKFRIFDEFDILQLSKKGYILNENEKIKRLNDGQMCVGLINGSYYSTFMWIELSKVSERTECISLKKNQAFLIGMKTIEKYRGKNLAPYLRFKAYLLLMNMGINEFYSFSDYFNTPSIKFKKKLNSRHMALRVYIEVFNKYKWNFLIRKYE